MTDRLTLAHALEEGGIAREPAERIATEIFDAITSNVASKSDLRELDAGLKADLREMEQRLDLRFAATKADTAAVRADMQAMEQRLEHQITRMTTRLGVLVVAVAGLASTIVHFWR